MYLPPCYDPLRSVYDNQILYETRMALALNVTTGDKVLDIGCGRGKVAALVHDVTGASVVGLNIDITQIEIAREFNRNKNASFVLADYNNPLPFPDGHFDAVYYVQVLSYYTDLDAFYSEVYRVLKPGGVVVFEDYVTGSKYDPNDSRHSELIGLAKPVLGGVCEVPPEVLNRSLKKAGFDIVSSKDESVQNTQHLLMQKGMNFYFPLEDLAKYMGKLGLFPKHFETMLNRMNKGADATVKAIEEDVLCLGWVTEAVKPK
jgi:sterol 24-C-methyltransferase